MKINLFTFDTNKAYFEVSTEYNPAYTSRSISNLFDLDLDTYNKILIDKVIQHNFYDLDKFDKDLTFSHNDIPKEIYIERFKDTFNKELIMLALGGNWNDD